jgi:rhodanese-related sulfurtransferase
MAQQSEVEPFSRIDVHEAKRMIDESGVQVVDSREPHEHDEGHVAGSVCIPHMSTLPRASELATDKPILFICKSGQRSAVAAEFASALGLTQLFNIEGGHDAWRDAGYHMDTA